MSLVSSRIDVPFMTSPTESRAEAVSEKILPSFSAMASLAVEDRSEPPPFQERAESVQMPYLEGTTWWLTEWRLRMTGQVLASSSRERSWKDKCCRYLRLLPCLSAEKAFTRLIAIESIFDRHFIDRPEWVMDELDEAKKRIAKASERTIGEGRVQQVDRPSPLRCFVTKSVAESESIDLPVRVLTAYLPGRQEPIGRCEFRMVVFQESCDPEYHCSLATGVIRIDSFCRGIISGIGTLLMQAAMECGSRYGGEGRIALHAEGSALGFYFKLGMRSASSAVNLRIVKELAESAVERRAPRDVLHDAAEFMYLPRDRMAGWSLKILQQPILYPPSGLKPGL
jgi:hypothetical protein